jgi:hypothetical protein
MDGEIFDRYDSVLCGVDGQKVFLVQLQPGEADSLTTRNCWLVRAATAFGIPIVPLMLRGNFYEWVRYLETLTQVKAVMGSPLPEGLVL